MKQESSGFCFSALDLTQRQGNLAKGLQLLVSLAAAGDNAYSQCNNDNAITTGYSFYGQITV